MSKLVVQMLFSSKKRGYYLASILPIIALNIYLYKNTLNFTVLLLVNYIATISGLIICFEVALREKDSDIFTYLKALKGENDLLVYRTKAIFLVSGSLSIVSSTIINVIYIKDIYITQQIIYLILILFENFFYIYFIQYLFVNVSNSLFRGSIIIAITTISMLSLMTRSFVTFIIFVTIIGLFLAVTFMNNRLIEELKRESKQDM